MGSFRDFEQGRWENAGVCAAYNDGFLDLVSLAIAPMLDAVHVGAGIRLLDLATGAGPVAAAAAARGANVLGLDFAAEQLRRARALHPGLTFELGDADATGLPDTGFDVVVCNFGVPHFPDPDAFVRESHRVLRPAGRFAYTAWAVPEQAKAFGAVLSAVGRHGSFDVGLPAGPNFFLHSDAATASASMAAAGFASVTVESVPMTWHVRDPTDIFRTMLNGTARTAALLRQQAPGALDKIRTDVIEDLAAYGSAAEGYDIPMPAILISGLRPE